MRGRIRIPSARTQVSTATAELVGDDAEARALYLPRVHRMTFTSIDFEQDPLVSDGPHAVGMVRVEKGRVVARLVSAIKWRRHLHAWPARATQYVMQREAPTFDVLWPRMRAMMDGAELLVAHNAAYDRGVLWHACRAYRIPVPPIPFLCTVALSRATWELPSHALNVVCEHLAIPLNHHEPLSDAEACARVLLAARPPRPEVVWKSRGRSALPGPADVEG